MSSNGHDASAVAPAKSSSQSNGRQLGVLLACFDGHKTAGQTHGAIEDQLRASGANVLDTTVFQVDGTQKAVTEDTHRMVWGTVIPGLTWAAAGVIFGGGWQGAIFWGVLGLIGGYFFSKYKIHIATKAQLAYLGSRLPGNSSTLLTYAETADVDSLLKVAASHGPSVASVASISDDMKAEVMHLTGKAEDQPQYAAEASPGAPTTLVNMILTRYPDPKTGRKITDAWKAGANKEMKEVKKQEADAKKAGGDEAKKAFDELVGEAEAAGADPEVEFVVNTDRDGTRHVFDPNLGPWAAGKGDIAGWGIFCAACGLIVGVIGNGFWGAVEGTLGAGILGAVCGLGAGALYGLIAGRAMSGGRLKSVGGLLAPGTSMIVAWAGGGLRPEGLAELATPDSQQLVVHFDAVAGGMALDV